MNQDTTEWLATANGSWIGCTEEGEVVYKNKQYKEFWEGEDGEDVRTAKRLIDAWAASKKRWAQAEQVEDVLEARIAQNERSPPSRLEGLPIFYFLAS